VGPALTARRPRAAGAVEEERARRGAAARAHAEELGALHARAPSAWPPALRALVAQREAAAAEARPPLPGARGRALTARRPWRCMWGAPAAPAPRRRAAAARGAARARAPQAARDAAPGAARGPALKDPGRRPARLPGPALPSATAAGAA